MLARKACVRTGYQNSNIVDTLAAAYAEAGDFDAAIRWSEESIQLLGAKANKELRADFESHLKMFKAKQPVRDKKLGTGE